MGGVNGKYHFEQYVPFSWRFGLHYPLNKAKAKPWTLPLALAQEKLVECQPQGKILQQTEQAQREALRAVQAGMRNQKAS